MFKKTLVIGLGLIGGSFAKALKKSDLSQEIFACDLDLETIDYAKNSGVIKDGFSELSFFTEDLPSFDFIVIATPLSSYDEIFFELKNTNSLVIDLGSIKNLDLEFYPKNFVPCHPIAGSEKDGFENAKEDLFLGKKFFFCKQHRDVVEMIKKIGAIPEFIEPKKHDEIFALVSHLPQFLSFLTAEFSPKKITDDFFKKAFRLDDSDPEIWSDIIAMNEENLEKFYDKFFVNLEKNIEPKFIEKSPKHHQDFDLEFFEKNFASIFFRALIAKSFVEIPEIKSYQNHAGSGFKDFTSIISIFDFDPKKLENLFAQNRGKILKFFNSLK